MGSDILEKHGLVRETWEEVPKLLELARQALLHLGGEQSRHRGEEFRHVEPRQQRLERRHLPTERALHVEGEEGGLSSDHPCDHFAPPHFAVHLE